MATATSTTPATSPEVEEVSMAPTFHPFPRLPREMQLTIWEEALRDDRRYVLIDAVSHFRPQENFQRRTAMGITPTPNLRRALLEVCHTARATAMKRCSVRLDVWERPSDMLENYCERASPQELPEYCELWDRSLDDNYHGTKLRQYKRQLQAIEVLERMNGGSALTVFDHELVFDCLSPKAQKFVRDEIPVDSPAMVITANALTTGIRRAQQSSETRDNIWAHKFPSAPTTKRGAIYIDPELDVFVVADTLTKLGRERVQLAGQPKTLVPHQRFIALHNFAGSSTTTLYQAGSATRISTPATDLRRILRRALQIWPAARYRRGCRYNCAHCAPEPFEMKHQRASDGWTLGRSDTHCADWFHVSLRQDLYGLEFCYRAYVDFATNEHAAILHDLCAGRNLMKVWGERIIGGFLPVRLRTFPN